MEDGRFAEMISKIAHELRSPLTSIKGFSSTLTQRWDRFTDDQRLQFVETIHADGRVERAQQIEALMKDRLGRLQAEDDRIGDVRGRGVPDPIQIRHQRHLHPPGDAGVQSEDALRRGSEGMEDPRNVDRRDGVRGGLDDCAVLRLGLPPPGRQVDQPAGGQGPAVHPVEGPDRGPRGPSVEHHLHGRGGHRRGRLSAGCERAYFSRLWGA